MVNHNKIGADGVYNPFDSALENPAKPQNIESSSVRWGRVAAAACAGLTSAYLLAKIAKKLMKRRPIEEKAQQKQTTQAAFLKK